MTRKIIHKRLTQPPKAGESPETVLEGAIIKLWQVQVAEQIVWLELRAYSSVETRTMVKEWHSSLSPKAVDFLTMVLRDAEGVEEDIRNTPSANSSYKAKGGVHAPNKINKGRLVRYLQRRYDIDQNKARNVVAELQAFADLIFKHTT